MLKRAGIVVVGFLCFLAIMPASAPVQLSYVYSDSMEPTIEQDDGYILVPASDVNMGDVVTFWSSNHDSYVTHRIVGRSDRGFITKGDANPSTDQAAGAAHVGHNEIRGKVLTVRGDPVVIPGLGHGVRFIQSQPILITGLIGAVLLWSLLRGRTSMRPQRSNPQVRDILWPVFAVAIVSAIGLQFAGGHTEQFQYVATESDTNGPNQLNVGEATTESVVINRSALPLTENIVSAEGMTITNQTRNESTIAVSMRIPPQTQTGLVTTKVRVNRYITVLPPEMIRSLHGIHPLLAASTTVGIVMGPLIAILCLVLDGKRPLRTVEKRWVRILKRKWREL